MTNVVTGRTIDSHIKNLRRKLESLDAEQSFIRAVYGWDIAGKRTCVTGIMIIGITITASRRYFPPTLVLAELTHSPSFAERYPENHDERDGDKIIWPLFLVYRYTVSVF